MAESLVHKAVRVLDIVFEHMPNPCRFKAIQKALDDLNPSSVTRLLKIMTETGLLRHVKGQGYLIGTRIESWCGGEQPPANWLKIARPSMVELTRRFASSTILWLRAGDFLMPFHKETDSAAPALINTGGLFRPYICWIGAQFFLGAVPSQAEELTLAMHGRGLCPHVTVDDVRKMLEYGIEHDAMDDRGVFYPGNYRLAVPIRHESQVVAALGIGVWDQRIRNAPALRTEILDALREERERIETALRIWGLPDLTNSR